MTTDIITKLKAGVRAHQIDDWTFSTKTSGANNGVLITARQGNRKAKGRALYTVEEAVIWLSELDVPEDIIASFIGDYIRESATPIIRDFVSETFGIPERFITDDMIAALMAKVAGEWAEMYRVLPGA